MSKNLVIIDGSVLEGGGQILRMAITLSALLQIPIRIHKIRAGRSKPGLAAQHLKGVQLVAEMCSAQLRGASMGSMEIEFWPKKLQSGEYHVDTGTAGSTSLLLQVALPCALFSPAGASLHLRGGTNAAMAPQIDFTMDIFQPHLQLFGAKMEIRLHRRGYFPRGGGSIEVTIDPVTSLQPVTLLSPGEVVSVDGRSFVSGRMREEDYKTMARSATEVLKSSLPNIKYSIKTYREQNGTGDCAAIILSCRTSTGNIYGGSGLNDRKLSIHEIGKNAAVEILNAVKVGACVDQHIQDQLIIFMALATGISKVKVSDLTLHTKTAIYVAELMTEAKFTLTSYTNGTTVIQCQGIGLKNISLNQKGIHDSEL